jgi:hypothetical protein
MDAAQCQADYDHPSSASQVPTDGIAFRVGRHVGRGLQIALRSQRLDSRGLELVRGLKIALENPSLQETWRSSPRAFEAAEFDHVHPDPETKATTARSQNASYRKITNRPEWSEI